MKSPKWRDEEIELLYSLAGDMPFQMVVTAFRHQAAMNGWEVRTANALLTKARRFGLRFRQVSGSWMTTGSISAVLGLSLHVVNRWFQRFPDIPRKRIGPVWYYRRSDLRSWASRHGHLFGGIPPSTLFMLFENQQLADWLAEQYPTRPTGCTRPPGKVRCIETGRVYPSHAAAAKAHWVQRSTISLAVKTGGKVAGKFHFQESGP